MNPHPPNLTLHSHSKERPFLYSLKEILNEVPLEACAFLVTSLAIRVLSPPLTAPLLGIGISMLTAKLVLNVASQYDNILLVNLTKEACSLNKKYPKLQMIALIFAMTVSYLYQPLSFAAGALIGSFGAVVLDIERYKLLQQSERNHRVSCQTRFGNQIG